MKNVFCLRNRLVGAWLDPIFGFETPADKARYATQFCILKPEEALKQGLNELDLYYFGTYDDEKGIFLLLDQPELLASLDKPFEQLKAAQKALEGVSNGTGISQS